MKLSRVDYVLISMKVSVAASFLLQIIANQVSAQEHSANSAWLSPSAPAAHVGLRQQWSQLATVKKIIELAPTSSYQEKNRVVKRNEITDVCCWKDQKYSSFTRHAWCNTPDEAKTTFTVLCQSSDSGHTFFSICHCQEGHNCLDHPEPGRKYQEGQLSLLGDLKSPWIPSVVPRDVICIPEKTEAKSVPTASGEVSHLIELREDGLALDLNEPPMELEASCTIITPDKGSRHMRKPVKPRPDQPTVVEISVNGKMRQFRRKHLIAHAGFNLAEKDMVTCRVMNAVAGSLLQLSVYWTLRQRGSLVSPRNRGMMGLYSPSSYRVSKTTSVQALTAVGTEGRPLHASTGNVPLRKRSETTDYCCQETIPNSYTLSVVCASNAMDSSEYLVRCRSDGPLHIFNRVCYCQEPLVCMNRDRKIIKPHIGYWRTNKYNRRPQWIGSLLANDILCVRRAEQNEVSVTEASPATAIDEVVQMTSGTVNGSPSRFPIEGLEASCDITPPSTSFQRSHHLGKARLSQPTVVAISVNGMLRQMRQKHSIAYAGGNLHDADKVTCRVGNAVIGSILRVSIFWAKRHRIPSDFPEDSNKSFGQHNSITQMKAVSGDRDVVGNISFSGAEAKAANEATDVNSSSKKLQKRSQDVALSGEKRLSSRCRSRCERAADISSGPCSNIFGSRSRSTVTLQSGDVRCVCTAISPHYSRLRSKAVQDETDQWHDRSAARTTLEHSLAKCVSSFGQHDLACSDSQVQAEEKLTEAISTKPSCATLRVQSVSLNQKFPRCPPYQDFWPASKIPVGVDQKSDSLDSQKLQSAQVSIRTTSIDGEIGQERQQDHTLQARPSVVFRDQAFRQAGYAIVKSVPQSGLLAKRHAFTQTGTISRALSSRQHEVFEKASANVLQKRNQLTDDCCKNSIDAPEDATAISAKCVRDLQNLAYVVVCFSKSNNKHKPWNALCKCGPPAVCHETGVRKNEKTRTGYFLKNTWVPSLRNEDVECKSKDVEAARVLESNPITIVEETVDMSVIDLNLPLPPSEWLQHIDASCSVELLGDSPDKVHLSGHLKPRPDQPTVVSISVNGVTRRWRRKHLTVRAGYRLALRDKVTCKVINAVIGSVLRLTFSMSTKTRALEQLEPLSGVRNPDLSVLELPSVGASQSHLEKRSKLTDGCCQRSPDAPVDASASHAQCVILGGRDYEVSCASIIQARTWRAQCKCGKRTYCDNKEITPGQSYLHLGYFSLGNSWVPSVLQDDVVCRLLQTDTQEVLESNPVTEVKDLVNLGKVDAPPGWLRLAAASCSVMLPLDSNQHSSWTEHLKPRPNQPTVVAISVNGKLRQVRWHHSVAHTGFQLALGDKVTCRVINAAVGSILQLAFVVVNTRASHHLESLNNPKTAVLAVRSVRVGGEEK